MAERTSEPPGTASVSEPALNVEPASRRQVNARRRREPYRPSSSTSPTTPLSTATAKQQQQHESSVTHAHAFTSATAVVAGAEGTSPMNTATMTTPTHEVPPASPLTLGCDSLCKAPVVFIAQCPTSAAAPREAVHRSATVASSLSLRSGVGIHSRGNSLSATACSGASSSQAHDASQSAATADMHPFSSNRVVHEAKQEVETPFPPAHRDKGAAAHAHGTPVVASPVRPSLPESMIQQVRKTPYSPVTSKPGGSAQHRRTASSMSVCVPSPTAPALATATPTSSEARQQLYTRTVSWLNGVAEEGVASAPPTTTVDAHTACNGARQPLKHHNSFLSIASASELTLPVHTYVPSLKEILSSSALSVSPAAGHSAMLAAVAHIMQRESIRQLLSRAILRWSFVSKTWQRRHTSSTDGTVSNVHERGAHADDSGRPAGASTPRSPSVNTPTSGAEKEHTTRNTRATSRSSEATEPFVSPMRPWNPIRGAGAGTGTAAEDGKADHPDDDEGGVGMVGDDDAWAGPDGVDESTRQSVAVLAVSQQDDEGAGCAPTGMPVVLVERRSAHGPTQRTPSSGQVRRQQERRSSLHCSGSAAHESLTVAEAGLSMQQSSASSRTSGVHDPPLRAAVRRSTSPGVNHHNSSNQSTSSNFVSTPHLQAAGGSGGGEARRKSIVSQYLAGKPPGSSSSQCSLASVLQGTGPAAGDLVADAHAYALPAPMISAHSRSQSGPSSSHASGALNNSLPRQRGDGMWCATATSAASGVIVPASALSDSEERSCSSLYFTPRSRQSNGVSGIAVSYDDEPYLSTGSTSTAATAAAAAAAAAAAVDQSLSPLLAREAEDRLLLQSSESSQRTRTQRKISARMDQLLMMALNRNFNERGLHPSLRTSLRTSLSLSPVPSPRSDSNSASSRRGDGTASDAVSNNCSAHAHKAEIYASSEGGSCGSGGSRLRRRTSTAAVPWSLSRRRLQTVCGPNVSDGPMEAAGDDADSLSSFSRDGGESVVHSGLQRRRHGHPLRGDTSSDEIQPFRQSAAAYDDESADTTTEQSESTLHGFATTRQWVSPSMPEVGSAPLSSSASLGVSPVSALHSPPPPPPPPRKPPAAQRN
ncbi:hypothetical protein ABL78_4793 [Leptomonas seymouri]|uniref:Uncharacterized protein n=1 Tax=Leptomonas seymouri TaxID=5684 RepID=A0A0N1HW19_LEPSE|nr:hypothetical protein ABL78_4793 [Leptomonas seymouri]|eukprot:KPI86138.1 hypothetical protein ABL78_4793 [Leptomonas seymouri]